MVEIKRTTAIIKRLSGSTEHGDGPEVDQVLYRGPLDDTEMRQFTFAEIAGMDTLSESQFDDLKIEEDRVRVWLSRGSIADGEPFNNKVTVERSLATWTCMIDWQPSQKPAKCSSMILVCSLSLS